jgi:N-acetylneuraminate lyase
MYPTTNAIKDQLQGVWPAMFTPVNEKGALNAVELEKLVNMLVAKGADGLYVLGSTGQGFLFSEKERMEIAELTIQITGKRVPVIIQVGALNTDECVRLAKHAFKAGADAISSVGPIYYSASANMAVAHYKKIAEATELPFIPYQIGNATNKVLIEKLLDIPNIIGMKLTTLNLLEISATHRITGNKWSLFSGADELMCQAALCGTAGAIGSTYNLLPDIFKKVRKSFLAGEVEMGNKFMLAFQNLIEDIIPVIWSFYRRYMVLKHSIDIGDPKPPILPCQLKWSDEEVLNMVDELENISAEIKAPLSTTLDLNGNGNINAKEKTSMPTPVQ